MKNMDPRKVLALTAISGILAGASSCGDKKADAKDPSSTNEPAPEMKNCCRGKNQCKNQSGCQTETNPAGAGQNACAGKGTSCPKG